MRWISISVILSTLETLFAPQEAKEIEEECPATALLEHAESHRDFRAFPVTYMYGILLVGREHLLHPLRFWMRCQMAFIISSENINLFEVHYSILQF